MRTRHPLSAPAAASAPCCASFTTPRLRAAWVWWSATSCLTSCCAAPCAASWRSAPPRQVPAATGPAAATGAQGRACAGHGAAAAAGPAAPPTAALRPFNSCPLAAAPAMWQTAATGEEFYRRLQEFRDELAGMPVAVQARWSSLGTRAGTREHGTAILRRRPAPPTPPPTPLPVPPAIAHADCGGQRAALRTAD